MEVIYANAPDAAEYFPRYFDAVATRSYNNFILEKSAAAIPLLAGSLAVADAKYSGRAKACVLETEEGKLYSGHTSEASPEAMVPAEIMGADRVPDGETVTMVYLAGKDLKKPKHVMPTAPVFDTIEPLLDEYAPIIVVGPNNFDSATVVSPQTYRGLFEPKPLSVLSGGYYDVMWKLGRETNLNHEDVNFLAQLHEDGTEKGVEYYLLGSASGRGSASNIFTAGWSYTDLDIAAVSEMETEAALEAFEKTAEVYYDNLEKTSHDVQIWPSGEVINGVSYTGNCRKHRSSVSIDFFTARSLAQALVRSENLERNFFHKIS